MMLYMLKNKLNGLQSLSDPRGKCLQMFKYVERLYCILFLQSDVNAVCFADETGHLIYSGSDDNLCKVNCIATLESME